jgi:hypothetical protein
MRRTLCLAATAIAIVGAAWAPPKEDCTPKTGQGTVYSWTKPSGWIETKWIQQLLCSAGDSSPCNWCMQMAVFVGTQYGWWPASFPQGGSNFVQMTTYADCAGQTVPTFDNIWGTMTFPPSYDGEIMAVWTLYSGGCGGDQVLQVSQTIDLLH